MKPEVVQPLVQIWRSMQAPTRSRYWLNLTYCRYCADAGVTPNVVTIISASKVQTVVRLD
jgi:hypothetical protein